MNFPTDSDQYKYFIPLHDLCLYKSFQFVNLLALLSRFYCYAFYVKVFSRFNLNLHEVRLNSDEKQQPIS